MSEHSAVKKLANHRRVAQKLDALAATIEFARTVYQMELTTEEDETLKTTAVRFRQLSRRRKGKEAVA